MSVAPATEPQTLPISWEELHRDTRTLAGRLLELQRKRGGAYAGIVAVTRGGLIPATIIARELGIRLLDTVCIASYDERDRGALKVMKGPDHAGDGEGWLVIDDLVDTGQTASEIRRLLPKAYFATVYAKPDGRPLVDNFVTEVSQTTWILFPWDIEPRFTLPLHAR